MSEKQALFGALATLMLSSVAGAQSIWRVDASAPPTGDGASWASALPSLDQALSLASFGDQVWVAAGRYRPRVPAVAADGRSASFRPAPGVQLYGGFDGTETLLADRSGLFDATILDGDIGVAGQRADNCYHVVEFEGNGAPHTLDGFRIQNGNADQASGMGSRGGAILSILGTKRIRNCHFHSNRARKGAALDASGGLIFLSSCLFESNRSILGGGAVRASFDIWATNCIFRGNLAGTAGGALFLSQNQEYPGGTPRPSFENCLFEGNAANNGGAVHVSDGSVTNTPGQANFTHCTFFGNLARFEGGAIWTPAVPTWMADCRVRNSIVWGNRAALGPGLFGYAGHFEVLYSTVRGGWSGAGNSSLDPHFVAAGQGDLSLGAGSPCIDAGSNELVLRDDTDLDADGDGQEPTPFDLLWRPRFTDDPSTPDVGAGTAPLTDMGCYEFEP